MSCRPSGSTHATQNIISQICRWSMKGNDEALTAALTWLRVATGIGTDECDTTRSHRMARERPSSPVLTRSEMICQGSVSNKTVSLVVELSVPPVVEALLFGTSFPTKRRREVNGKTYEGFRSRTRGTAVTYLALGCQLCHLI